MPATNLQVVNNQSDASPSATFAEPLTVAAVPGNVTLITGDAQIENEIAADEAKAEAALTNAIAERVRLKAEAAAAAEAFGRLQRPIDEEAHCQGELAAFDADEAQAMAAWSKNGVGEPPEPRTNERAEIAGRLRSAKQKAAAARGAQQLAEAEITAANGKLPQIESRIAACVQTILFLRSAQLRREIAPLFNDIEDRLRDLFGLAEFAIENAHDHSNKDHRDAMLREAVLMSNSIGKFIERYYSITGLQTGQAKEKWRAVAAEMRERK
jgi:hypothetical protein